MAAIAFNAAHRNGERSGVLPTNSPDVIAQFRPLDPGILNEAIPAFFIGRNKEGFWVARDARGRIGGTPLCRLPGGIAVRQDAQPSFRPSGSNSTWKTEAIRLPPSLER